VRRLRPLLILVAAALVAASCAAETAADRPATTAAPDGTRDERRVDVDVDGEVTANAGTTEATLQRMLAMDPGVLAGAHDHGDPADHAAHDHPNGIDPERIVIPAIDVDAEVIDLGLQPDGTMEVPTDFAHAGWFDRGPKPGRVGPAVIAGHVDDRSGPAVFHALAELRPGDLIEVHGAGEEVVTFAVRETQQHPKDAFPTDAVYGGTPGPELRLITCSGEFDRDERSYRDNTIVFAERVDG
jgi:sortase (surface protein transpeptidase)